MVRILNQCIALVTVNAHPGLALFCQAKKPAAGCAILSRILIHGQGIVQIMTGGAADFPLRIFSPSIEEGKGK
jgi:hypothetical protein